MKKILILLLSLLLSFSLAGCVTINVTAPAESQKPTPAQEQQEADSGNSVSPENNQEKESVAEEESEPTASDQTQYPEDGEPNLTELYEKWATLVGYWNASEGRYVIIDMEDSHTGAFAEGVWEAGGGRGYGRVINIGENKPEEFTITVLYPATEATEMNDAMPEQKIAVIIDYSGKERDGKIRIKIGDEDFKQYRFAGQFSEEAYNTYIQDNYGE